MATLSSLGWSWPARRQFALARLRRVAVRHLASVSRQAEQYRASCVCGWHAEGASHPGSAFAAAHVHTRHVTGVITDLDMQITQVESAGPYFEGCDDG
jgi:hypothetical protein